LNNAPNVNGAKPQLVPNINGMLGAGAKGPLMVQHNMMNGLPTKLNSTLGNTALPRKKLQDDDDPPPPIS